MQDRTLKLQTRVAIRKAARITNEIASIRTKAVSGTELFCPVFVTPRAGQSLFEDQDLRARRRITLREALHYPSIRPLNPPMIFLATIRPPDRCGSGKRSWFSKAYRAVFCNRSVWMRERSINFPV